MAVYTPVPAEALEAFLRAYDVGILLSAKGIAEGVQNSNFLIETSGGRYFLTLYETAVAAHDLPYFLALTAHLADHGLPVPRPIPDRSGTVLQTLEGRPACLIEFLSGISLTEPTPAHCHAAGAALGRLHKASADFAPVRDNDLGPAGWQRLFLACTDHFDDIAAGLGDEVESDLNDVIAHWPDHLTRATIHADLFPDNVLMQGTKITGLIDFYFACTEIRAYDLAVLHTAWAFTADGAYHSTERAEALNAGYRETHGLTDAEAAAMPILCRGACLRFLLTRAYDWIHTPADALVTRKDPLAYLRRLQHYRTR